MNIDREDLEILRSQASRVARESRILKTMVARLLSAATSTSTAEEAHENDRRSSTDHD